jgi:preprotein translocase subunit SecE
MFDKITSYVRESREELRKVVWPNRETVVRDTLIVVGISVAMAIFFGALDFGLNLGFEGILERAAAL